MIDHAKYQLACKEAGIEFTTSVASLTEQQAKDALCVLLSKHCDLKQNISKFIQSIDKPNVTVFNYNNEDICFKI